MAPHTYGEILARNIRAARSRADLGQDSVAARMRALGFKAWIRQTVSSTERGRRRPTAEEIMALAYVLHTSIRALVAPSDDDQVVDLPSGAVLDAASVDRSARGTNDGGILWDGDEPYFSFAEGQALPPPQRVWPPALQQHFRERAAAFPVEPDVDGQRPVAAAIVVSGGRVLIGQRNDREPPWTFIAGEVEPGDDAGVTACRETKEESGLRVRAVRIIGRRDHPHTGRHMIYVEAKPIAGTEVHVGDEAELAAVDWFSLDAVLDLMPDMFEPVREYLARELGSEG